MERFAALETRLTEAVGDAERLAREWCAGHPGGTIVVIGGDGSLHEAVNGMLDAAAPVRLAIVPAGTGNDMARNLALPLDPLAAARAIQPGVSRPVDAGRCGFQDPRGMQHRRWFINSVSVGVSARANRLARPIGRVVRGTARYPVAGALAVATGRPAGYVARSGGRILFEGRALNLTVANGPGFGGGLPISPESNPRDGRFELVIIGNLSRRRALGALARLRRGGRVEEIEVHHVGGPAPAVEIRTDEPGAPLEADGENFRLAGTLVVELLPGRLVLAASNPPA